MRRFLPVMALLLLPATGSADIFRQVDEQGVAVFTDAPTDHRFELVLKEWPTAPAPKPRGAVPSATVGGTASSTKPVAAASAGSTVQQLPVQGRITSLNGVRIDPFDGKLRHHNGIDIAVPSGTPVKPVAPGTVIYSGYRGGYGNMVAVQHDDGTCTLYAHNSSNLVAEGTPVDNGTVIALTGSTGRSTGPHLHFEAWRNGENISASYLPGANGSTPRNTTIAIRRQVQADGTILFTNLP